MSVLLPTRLPLARGETVSTDTFNRLVRVLELNLGGVNFSISPHFSATDIAQLQFATGAIIFNTTNSIHQAFDGGQFRDLYDHHTYPAGIEMSATVGAVTVNTP